MIGSAKMNCSKEEQHKIRKERLLTPISHRNSEGGTTLFLKRLSQQRVHQSVQLKRKMTPQVFSTMTAVQRVITASEKDQHLHLGSIQEREFREN